MLKNWKGRLIRLPFHNIVADLKSLDLENKLVETMVGSEWVFHITSHPSVLHLRLLPCRRRRVQLSSLSSVFAVTGITAAHVWQRAAAAV